MAPKAFDKGSMHTVEAFERLLDTGYDVTLVFAGPTFAAFREFYARLSPRLRERILLMERVEGDEKNDLFAAGDIYVMPSRNDSFGIVYLEAWACGKPVIGAIAGGVPEVIEDGLDGYLVPFGDVDALAARIAELLDNPGLARTMGERGREKTLSRYTWDIQYARLKELYRSLGCDV